MRRHNYQRILSWLTPENVEGFYRTIDEHRQNRALMIQKRHTGRGGLRPTLTTATDKEINHGY